MFETELVFSPTCFLKRINEAYPIKIFIFHKIYVLNFTFTFSTKTYSGILKELFHVD